MKTTMTMLASALILSACGGAGSAGDGNGATAQRTPETTLNELNAAYASNAVRAKRDWGGRKVLLGGKFFSAGKNPDGTTSVLLGAGTPSLGEFVFAPGHEDFISKLNKNDLVTVSCTVDADYDGVSGAKLVGCVPGTVTAADT